MRLFTYLFLALACLGLVASQHVLAGQQLDVHDGSAITITSPQNGAAVGSSFDLAYSFRKGLMADHVHVFYGWKVSKGV